MWTLIISLFFLRKCSFFVMQSQEILYLAQTGQVVDNLGVIQFKQTGDIHKQQYNVSLKSKFNNRPAVILGIVDIQTINSGGFGAMGKTYDLTFFVVKGTQSQGCPCTLSTSTVRLRLYYFAYDTQVRNIYHYICRTFCTSHTDGSNVNCSFITAIIYSSKISNQKDFNHSNVKILSAIYSTCHLTYTSPNFKVDTYIDSITQKSFRITMLTNQQVSFVFQCRNYFVQATIIILLQNKETLVIKKIVDQSIFISGLNYQPGDPHNLYFIGLSGMYYKKRMINISLTNQDHSLLSNSDVHYIRFQAAFLKIQGDMSTLKLVESSIFKQNPILDFYYIDSFNQSSQVNISNFTTSSSVLKPDNVSYFQNNLTSIFNVNASLLLESQPIEIKFKDQKGWKTEIRKTESILFFTKQIDIKPLENNLSIFITGKHSSSQQKFSINPYFSFQNLFEYVDSTQFKISYNIDDIGKDYTLSYYDIQTGNNIKSHFCLPTMNFFLTSTISNLISLSISHLPSSILPLKDDYLQLSQNLTNKQITDQLNANLSIEYTYHNQNVFLENQLTLSKSQLFKMNMIFKIPTVFSLTVYSDLMQFQIHFINVNITGLNLSNFTLNNTSLNLYDIVISQQNISLYVKYNTTQLDTLFQLEMNRLDYPTKVIVKDLEIHKKFLQLKGEQYLNFLNITFDNEDGLIKSDLSQRVSVISPNVKIIGLDIVDDNILITIEYNKTIEQTYLKISYDKDKTTIYRNIQAIKMQIDYPLVYCKGLFPTLSKLYKYYSLVISALYLILFIVAFISYNKIMAVETIFLAQLSFYSFIPIGMFCKPFADLIGLQYVRGYNPFFHNVQQPKTSFHYSSMNIYSNFTSNLNVMILPIAISFILYVPFRIVSYFSSCYKRKPRFLKYAKSCILEVPLAILLFNSFNIYSSLIVQIQSYTPNQINQLLVALFIALLLPIYWFICFFLRKHFSQFKEEFEDRIKLYDFSLETSKSIRCIYPLLLILEMLIIPLLISSKKLFKISIEIIIFIQFALLIFTSFFKLYFWGYQNIRIIIHRSIVVGICLIQIIELFFKHDYNEETSFVYWMPLGVLIMLTLGFLINGACIFWMAYKWYHKRGVIDMKMKLALECTLTKQQYNPFDMSAMFKQNKHQGKNMLSRRQYIKNKIPNINNRTNQEVKDCMILIQHKSYDWFKQIQQKNLFVILGIDNDIYSLQKNNLIGQYNSDNCCKTFRFLSRFLSDKIVSHWQSQPDQTLRQYINQLPQQQLLKIRQFNVYQTQNMKPLIR